jgi:protein tyrosine/serine phosphatase
MQPRGLIGLGHDTLAASTPEILAMMTRFSQPDTYPVLIHCSQGKDRTGITIALLLLLLSEPESDPESESAPRIPLSAIIADYTLSDPGLQVEREDWIGELTHMGLGPEFAECAPGFIEEVKRYLDERYGGVRGYLRSIGVEDGVMAQVRRLLLEDSEEADSDI